MTVDQTGAENPLDEQADSYRVKSAHDLDQSLTFSWYSDRIKALAPRGTLLDLGIGYGEVMRRFARFYSRYVVVEGSLSAITVFHEEHPHLSVEIVHSLFEEFQTEERFDSIVMGFVLEHVDEPIGILGKYKDFLTPDGSVYIAVPNAASLHRRIGQAAGFMPDVYELSDYDRRVGHKRYFDLDTLSSMVEIAGYRIIRKEGLLLKPFASAQMNSLNLSQDVLRALLKVGMELPQLGNSILIQIQPKSNNGD